MNPPDYSVLTRQIQAFFDQRADAWDAQVCPQHVPRLTSLIQYLNIPNNVVILDVGSGSGVLLPILAPCESNGRFIVPIDISFHMLRVAKKRMDYNRDMTKWLQTDAMHLPFYDETFDWIICNSVFPHFIDQQAVLSELTRVLRYGGSLVVCHSQSREAINKFHRSHGGLVGGHELPEKSVMERMLIESGLGNVRYENTDDHYLLHAMRCRSQMARNYSILSS